VPQLVLKAGLAQSLSGLAGPKSCSCLARVPSTRPSDLLIRAYNSQAISSYSHIYQPSQDKNPCWIL
jgi:hypothetical protein